MVKLTQVIDESHVFFVSYGMMSHSLLAARRPRNAS